MLFGTHPIPLPQDSPSRRELAFKAPVSGASRDLLEILSRHVSVIRTDQLVDSALGLKMTVREVGVLRDAGLLSVDSAWIVPYEVPAGPLAVWEPHCSVPPFPSLAYAARKRWDSRPLRVEVARATKLACAQLGSQRPPADSRSELSHNIALAQIYFQYRQSHRTATESWVPEWELYDCGFGRDSILPDAAYPVDGKMRFVELLGSYSARKLKHFHDFCESCQTGYEFW